MSKSKTLGQVPEETSCSSGYIADASSARTPGLFLHTTQTQDMRKQHTKNGKNFVMQYEKDEEDEEPTGFFGIMSEFQKGAGLLPSSSSKSDVTEYSQKKKEISNLGAILSDQSLHQNTDDISQLVLGDANLTHSKLQVSLKPSFLGTTGVNDISLTNSSMQGVLGISKIQVPGPDLDLTPDEAILPEPGLKLSHTGLKLPELDLERTQNRLSLEEEQNVNYNPLDTSIHRKLLNDLKVPLPQRHGYYYIDANVPYIRPQSTVQIGTTTFIVKECKGKILEAFK